jgi:hypothetical protein
MFIEQHVRCSVPAAPDRVALALYAARPVDACPRGRAQRYPGQW